MIFFNTGCAHCTVVFYVKLLKNNYIFTFALTVSTSKLSGAQKKKLQKEKDDKYNGVMEKVKKLNNYFNVLS